MGNTFIGFLIINIFLVTALLWLLTFFGYITNKKFNKLNERSLYECGFKSTTNTTINLSLNSITSAIFLVLYEIEFIVIIPYIFNVNVVGTSYMFLVFFTSIIISFFIDIFIDSIY